VILSGWPHLAVEANRDDGSLATNDLCERHHYKEDAWRYHSRSNSLITLTTRKKFNPILVEDALASSSELIKEVFGF